jgi:hypothetical protein
MADCIAKRGPTFIGVGPGKTGTTWIYANLKAHPKVIVPPLKELRYFWEHAHFPNERILFHIKSKDSWHREQHRNFLRRFLKRYSRNPTRLFTAKRLVWDCRYLVSRHDDDYYLRCFRRKDGFVCGEVSPQYFFLVEHGIKHIRDLLPDVKIVVSLREPTDWFWSTFRMAHRDLTHYSDQVFDHYLGNVRAECSFSKALALWRRHFREEQILVVYYDELSASPWEFYSRICAFLEIEPDRARLPELVKRVNPGNERTLSEERRAKIARAWRDDIEQLAVMLPSLPENWLNVRT